MVKRELWYHLALWLVAAVLAFLVGRFLSSGVSTFFWMPAESLPTTDGGSISVPSWRAIPVSEIWYYLILSIAGGITVARIFFIIACSALAHNWTRACVWLGGLLGFGLLAYVISLLAYSVGTWQRVGLIVFYNTRGPLGTTLVFATAIIVAKLLSNAAQSNTGKKSLFLTLSGLLFAAILIFFAIAIPSPRPPAHSNSAIPMLIVLDGLLWVALALTLAFAMVKLALRRKPGAPIAGKAQ